MSGPPFRAEVIGSLLRPRILKDTATAIAAGKADPGDYQAVLEREIARVVARQEELGLRVVSDGEFGRTSWFGFFFEGLDGFSLMPSLFRFREALYAQLKQTRDVTKALRHSLRAAREFFDASHAAVAVARPGEAQAEVLLAIPDDRGFDLELLTRFIRSRLKGRDRRGAERYPAGIREWRNLAARGGLTALERRMAREFRDMVDLGLTERITDRVDLINPFRGPDGLNVHKCYGYFANAVTGEAIARWWRGLPGASA